MEGSEDLSFCPSFNSYSSDKLAEIAAKVSAECIGSSKFNDDVSTTAQVLHELEDDDDFEFSLVRSDPDSSADEIVYNGQIRPFFPIFNRDLVQDREIKASEEISSLRIPLKKLFIAEGEPPSSSSSEADELESVPEGTYCVWRPKVVESSPNRCKKSNSTGSASKRWKFRDLLRRSNSDGKDSFVFLTPKNREEKAERSETVENSKEKRNSTEIVKFTGKVKAKGVAGGEKGSSSSAHEVFYVRNRAIKEGDKRKSYLPYRQDLVGFFANVNGLGKAFPPF